MSFEKFGKAVATILIVPVIVALSAAIAGLPIKWLWNWLMPDLFGLKQITFLQAAGLSFLFGMLFKSTNYKPGED